MNITQTVAIVGREAFLRKTYSHLFFAILGLVGLEYLFFSSGFDRTALAIVQRVNWLWILGAFMLVAWLATRAAHTAETKLVQYLALSAYVLAEALILLPMLAMAYYSGHAQSIESAAYVTIIAFLALTAIVFMTKKDFSFLRTALMWGGVVALLAIVAGGVFGFSLGHWFSMAMILLAGAAILYDTSNVLHHYPQDKYVSASLQLFASVALMFWYVLQLFMSRD